MFAHINSDEDASFQLTLHSTSNIYLLPQTFSFGQHEITSSPNTLLPSHSREWSRFSSWKKSLLTHSGWATFSTSPKPYFQGHRWARFCLRPLRGFSRMKTHLIKDTLDLFRRRASGRMRTEVSLLILAPPINLGETEDDTQDSQTCSPLREQSSSLLSRSIALSLQHLKRSHISKSPP